ncbi:Sir2 family NAD-dependent protein deacetylase [Herbaspirillum sp. RTI4]|uniref:SIR2 family NAD-dependent protein deacylase n=1 Tax=Herbaspirillum sp. RTI4 TaxID=3048640 RepID=UPI002AB3D4B0|nr:Sir2 family NAD-dependent protein deacetylase [Herbaspirillum sp. RTI4]MDY7579939.1 Sir2 family NAD-dependent protein deacetylase [Herbaspirillum sp. RTI4]
MPVQELDGQLRRAVKLIGQADSLIIAAGAGMGIDSGLPDFRGKNGFWKAYPALEKSGIDFYAAASGRSFQSAPIRAWGFYGHRLALYRQTRPHVGFDILRTLGEKIVGGYGVFTSNVDGHFQRAGFDPDRVHECHGSIHFCNVSLTAAMTFGVQTNFCRSLIWTPAS